MNTKIDMRTGTLLLIFMGALAFTGCKKKDHKNILTSKTWKRGMTDKNPATNPDGNVLYYAVQDCDKDDTFKFGTNGQLMLNRGEDKCDPDEVETEVLSYTIDRSAKKITIDGMKYDLLEESNNQIKLALFIPYSTGYQNRTFIFLLQ